jgi:hypothetical protein
MRFSKQNSCLLPPHVLNSPPIAILIWLH